MVQPRLCSSVSSIRPAGDKWRREESVGGRGDLPGDVFLPFIWTGIGIQFQLLVLHLLKHTRTQHPVRWREQGMLEQHRGPQEAPVQLCETVASGKGLHTDYNTHAQMQTCTRSKALKGRAAVVKGPHMLRQQKYTQMCKNGLQKGIRLTNKEQGEGPWERLDSQLSSQPGKIERRQTAV